MLKIDCGEASDSLLHDLQLCGNDAARERIRKYLDSAFKQGVDASAKLAESCEATTGSGVGKLQRKIAKAIRALVDGM